MVLVEVLMIGAKRLLEQMEARRDAAIDIAIAAKVLRVCEYHGDVVMVVDGSDERLAYAIGNSRLNKGEYRDVFTTPKEMAESVKAAIDEHALYDCPRCEKLLAD